MYIHRAFSYASLNHRLVNGMDDYYLAKYHRSGEREHLYRECYIYSEGI
jgi:hypothetical protein